MLRSLPAVDFLSSSFFVCAIRLLTGPILGVAFPVAAHAAFDPVLVQFLWFGALCYGGLFVSVDNRALCH